MEEWEEVVRSIRAVHLLHKFKRSDAGAPIRLALIPWFGIRSFVGGYRIGQ